MKKFWPFTFFFLFFAAVACFVPFLVFYYQDLGFSGAQIGLLTGIGPLITLVTVPFWTRTADRTSRHRLITSLSVLISAASLALYPYIQSFTAVFILTLITTIFFAPITSLANSATMYMLGDEKDRYGRVRTGGTFGFGLAALLAGAAVAAYGLPVAFWLAAAFTFLSFLVSLPLRYGKVDPREADAGGGIPALIKKPSWIFFLLIAFAGGIAFAANNNFFFPYMQELGAGEGTMGLALTLGTIAELPVLILANRFIARFNAFGTLILSVVFTGLRLILLGLTGSVAVVMIIQLLSGLTFPLMMVAGVSYADEHAPQSLRATAQGLFNASLMGIGTAVGGFVSGILLARLGGQGLYMATGVVVLLILALVLFARSKFPSGQTVALAEK